MFNSQSLAENIKKYRLINKMSQKNLAQTLNVSPQSVSKWESGICVPDVEKLCLMSKLFSISLDSLFAGCAEYKKVMIAVDGGGTKTHFVLFDEEGTIYENIKLGPCNPNTVGTAGSIEVLENGIGSLMKINPNVCGVFVGAAGFLLGNNSDAVLGALKRSYPNVKIDGASDMLNISASELEDDTYCISAICGTGSSILVKQDKQLKRLSGYGYLLSKSGSGYDMGRDALYAVLCDLDGVGEKTVLTSLVKAKLGNSASDIIDKVYKNDTAFTASVACLVFEAEKEGDKVAKRIVEENAKGFADWLNLAHKNNHNIKNAVVSGGIIAHNPSFAKVVYDNVDRDLNLIVAKSEPVLGACVQCARMCNVKTENLLSKLKENYIK